LLGGTIDLSVDFATHVVTGTFHAIARKSTDNSLTDMGVFTLTNGTIDSSGVITGSLGPNPNPFYISLTGGFRALLSGPTANELGIRMSFRTCHQCLRGPGDTGQGDDAFYASGVASKR